MFNVVDLLANYPEESPGSILTHNQFYKQDCLSPIKSRIGNYLKYSANNDKEKIGLII